MNDRFEGSRRIDPTTNKDPHRENKLKAVAGLIEKLTYSEMKTLADHVGQTLDVEREGLEDDLIQLSQRILAQ